MTTNCEINGMIAKVEVGYSIDPPKNLSGLTLGKPQYEHDM
jgi:hypothetical protein